MNCFLACLPAFEFSMPTIKFHNGRYRPVAVRTPGLHYLWPDANVCTLHNSQFIKLDFLRQASIRYNART